MNINIPVEDINIHLASRGELRELHHRLTLIDTKLDAILKAVVTDPAKLQALADKLQSANDALSAAVDSQK